MKVLKGFGTAILSFLLFLSLSVFGVAFMLNSTLLNPDFVTEQMDKIEVSTLVREITEEQIAEQLPEEASFVQDAIYDIIAEQEPLLKEQVNTAIHAAYDFLLGETENLNIVISLEALKESLKDSLWNSINEYLSDGLVELPEDLLKPYIEQHYDEFAEEIPEEYLPPELAGMTTDELMEYLDQNYEGLIEQIPVEQITPELTGLLEDELKPYYDQYYDEFAEEIPLEFTFDKDSLSQEAMEQVMLARKYIGYFQDAYYYLIGFMVLLALGIFLINRNVKDTTRSLGISFFIYGALEFAGVYIARSFMPTDIAVHEIPSSLQTWVSGLATDLLAPLQTFSLGLLIAGVVLIVVSIVYKSRAAEE